MARVRNRLFELVAVECEGEYQGLLAYSITPRPASLTPGKQVVYVDYLEVAPQNIRVGEQQPRFLGVGTAMMAEAIRISQERGFGARIGLHSLDQAERFYTERCRMTRVGPDPEYYDLVYLSIPKVQRKLGWPH